MFSTIHSSWAWSIWSTFILEPSPMSTKGRSSRPKWMAFGTVDGSVAVMAFVPLTTLANGLDAPVSICDTALSLCPTHRVEDPGARQASDHGREGVPRAGGDLRAPADRAGRAVPRPRAGQGGRAAGP